MHVTPLEFWKLTPGDFWLAYDALKWSQGSASEQVSEHLTMSEFDDIMTFDKRVKKGGS